MAGLYFHIPFCKRVCAYCDFYKSARVDRLDETLFAIEQELIRESNWLTDRRIRTIYFGGGTPSLCRPEQLQRLIDRAKTLFDCGEMNEAGEITVEVNPDDLTEEWLDALACTDINRLSIGIQSFDDGALRFMNRRHTSQQAVDAVRRAQERGFRNITIDLIFGVPGFPVDGSLEKAVQLDVPHISAYHLTIEPGTAFGRRGMQPVADEVSEREYMLIHSALTRSGYEHYEVSNYARPGFRAQHNSAYWTGQQYLGCGPAAHSYNGNERRYSESSLAAYLRYDAAAGPQLPAKMYHTETLTATDRYNEYLMTRLRTTDGIDLSDIPIEKRHAIENHPTLRRDGDRMAIPPEKFMISDSIIASLFVME